MQTAGRTAFGYSKGSPKTKPLPSWGTILRNTHPFLPRLTDQRTHGPGDRPYSYRRFEQVTLRYPPCRPGTGASPETATGARPGTLGRGGEFFFCWCHCVSLWGTPKNGGFAFCFHWKAPRVFLLAAIEKHTHTHVWFPIYEERGTLKQRHTHFVIVERMPLGAV